MATGSCSSTTAATGCARSSRALAIEDFDEFDLGRAPVALLRHHDAVRPRPFPLPQAFPPFSLARILAEVLADQGRTQFRTAETEKYPHVTYFFNGGYEPPYPGEERCLIPSQRVATYDLAPGDERRGASPTPSAGRSRRDAHDFMLCNYANADMVGHTGVLPAVIKAVETVDACLARVLASAERAGASVLITADHGNCEMMIDPVTGGVHTAHTTNPVPFVAVRADDRGAARRRLAPRRGADGAPAAGHRASRRR